MSTKQSAILAEIKLKGQLTLDRAVELVGADIFANERFHVGNILSNMVKRGMIRRVKPGLFAMPEKKPEPEDFQLQ